MNNHHPQGLEPSVPAEQPGNILIQDNASCQHQDQQRAPLDQSEERKEDEEAKVEELKIEEEFPLQIQPIGVA